jgi:diguanylate cyclase (GGDEF)-like protein/PAS domain S-box-containing protein
MGGARGAGADAPELYKAIVDHLGVGLCVVNQVGLVTTWNPEAERLTGLTAGEVIGPPCCAGGVLTHLDAQAKPLVRTDCPIALTLMDGEPRETVTALRRADGQRLPVLARLRPLRDPAGRVAGVIEVFSDHTAAALATARVAELQKLALLDPLTAIGNRRFVEMQLQARCDALHRYGWSFGVLFMDLNSFKEVNDRHGHAAGDRVLRCVGRALTGAVRSFDVVGRWGGDEFVAVVANVNEGQLLGVGRKLQRIVVGLKVGVPGVSGTRRSVQVSLSAGAALAHADETPDALLRRADASMYQGKRSTHLEAATH